MQSHRQGMKYITLPIEILLYDTIFTDIKQSDSVYITQLRTRPEYERIDVILAAIATRIEANKEHNSSKNAVFQSAKGLLEDLYTYIKNDSEINMDDYFANVFDAISIDGKLPYITNGVSISTMLANSSTLGENFCRGQSSDQ